MRQGKIGFFYLMITVIFFSTYEVVSKMLVGKIDPFQINFIRFLTGGIILFIISIIKSDIKIGLKDFLWVFIIGIINVVISMNLLQLSLYTENAKASVIAVIFSSNPIFVTVFSALINKERITVNKIAGLLIGVCGIIVIFFENLHTGLSDFRSPVLALLSAVTYGLYTIVGGRVSNRIGSLKMNAYSFLIGSMVLLPVLLFTGVPVVSFDWSGIVPVIYLSVFVTGLAYLTYFKGLSIVGASKGSLIFFIKPVLASMIAVIFLKESATPNLLFGTLMIILGISVSIYWEKVKASMSNKYKK